MDLIKAQEVLQEDSETLALSIKKGLVLAVEKANDMISSARSVDTVLTGMKVLDMAGKMTGIIAEKHQTNIQVNMIDGFEYIEIDDEVIKQYQLEQINSDNIIELQ